MDQNKTTGRYRLIIWFVVAAVTAAIDQISKWLVQNYLKPVGDLPIIKDVLHFTYVENTGAAFGMLKDQRWIFMVISTVAIVLIVGYMIIARKSIDMLSGTALGLIVGGGVGNMIDRIVLGYVTDFVNFELIDFAVFNLADSAVCIGAGLLVLAVIISIVKEASEDKKKRSEETADDRKESNKT